jgi:hypothetical protein
LHAKTPEKTGLEPVGQVVPGPIRQRVTLNPGAATQDYLDGEVLVWLEGKPEPLVVGVMELLSRMKAWANP